MNKDVLKTKLKEVIVRLKQQLGKLASKDFNQINDIYYQLENGLQRTYRYQGKARKKRWDLYKNGWV